MQEALGAYFLIMNSMAFFLYSLDKYKALKNSSRISEKKLHRFALLGGFFGASLGMILFRHKVSKVSFLWKHLLIVFAWLGVVFYFCTQFLETFCSLWRFTEFLHR